MDVDLIPYINILPDDVLVEIFLILTQIWARRSYPKILTFVCSRWRELALHTPLLWTEIKIALYSAKSCRDALDYFERSKPALIDVRFHNYGLGRPAVPKYRESIYNALVYHASRLRKLVLRLPSPKAISVVLDGWASTDADVGNLKYLSIWVVGDVNVSTFSPWKGIQALRSLDIRDLEITSLPPAPNLNFLSIGEVDSSPETFQILFANYPLLETLVIHYLGQSLITERDEHKVQAINAPRSLHSLSIRVESVGSFDECSCILPQLLHADTLEYVEIEGGYKGGGGRVLYGHHASMFTRWKDIQHPRTLLVDCYALRMGDVVVLGRLPDTIDLELKDIHRVYESNHRGDILVAVLALKNLRSLTLNLRKRNSDDHYFPPGRRGDSILKIFMKIIRERRPELGSPTFLRVDDEEANKGLEAKMEEYFPVGSKLTILRTPISMPHSVLDMVLGAIDADPRCYSDEDNSDEGNLDEDDSDSDDLDAEDSG